MSKKHKIKFVANCTAEEHEKAWFLVQYRCGLLQFWWLVLLVSALFIVLATNILLFSDNQPLVLWAFLFCAVAVALPAVYFTFSILQVNKRRRHYLQKYMSVGERELTVFSHSISVSSMLVSTDIPFSDCRFLVERKDFFLLIQNRRGYLIIPKRDVPEGQMEELKKRLKRASAVYRLFYR